MSPTDDSIGAIATAFLARGADVDWYSLCERFRDSYLRNRPGIEHSLYVIFKGFRTERALEKAKTLFSSISHTPLLLDDNSFDIGAYIEWANRINEKTICVLNTTSEILAEDWLLKLAVNLALPRVGLVGATGSYESLSELSRIFPKYPNIHIRSNAFMIGLELFHQVTQGLAIAHKIDAFLFESGPRSMTRQVLAMGKEVAIVGRNGRGYSPPWWPMSDIFRQGAQSNLLVADNQTRNFQSFAWAQKREFAVRTWRHYLREEKLLAS